jgi:hypothetical protein
VTTLLSGFKAGLAALVELVREFAKLGQGLCLLWRSVLRACRNLGKHPSRNCCLDLPPGVHKRADPLIYDQYYLMAQGLSVTWDNPDIDILSSGAVVDPWMLKPDTEYDVRVRVWNGSYDAPAIGLPVVLSYLSFGIGVTRTFVGLANTDLGVKASSQCPAFATIPWRTPANPGHYCLQAFLSWPDDANPDNNLGQKNTQVGRAASPALFSFLLHNEAAVRQRFQLEADAYALPDLPPCGDAPPADGRRQSRLAESRARWEAALAAQRYGKFSVVDHYNVSIEPADVELDAGQTITVSAAIQPLDPAFSGRRAINVHGFVLAEGRSRRLAGGVTLLVEK